MADYCAGPVFEARFPSRSAGCCGEPIEEGEEIRMVDGVATHVDCHDCTCGECE
jgi:hypothetical protein